MPTTIPALRKMRELSLVPVRDRRCFDLVLFQDLARTVEDALWKERDEEALRDVL